MAPSAAKCRRPWPANTTEKPNVWPPSVPSLLQENESMRSQNAALQQVDTERLASFLPALFPRVFTVLGAADLALLCGRVEPLAIPNPYPEPSEEALRTLQKISACCRGQVLN